ncbi:26S proteasome non-ATPase regulatory subunit 1 isoform X1 [Salvelinus sp. IW2-2015]|uniref:26S proteasome non-ATPase regulatory subunit 1 isoform X1 n=1 Tax=Salvelinus sp. IW2-2015 TaxID=2691554 RepID=UPI000CDFD4E6|nr:26S proteasome non-ATPase regulatory subunit 1 [Salvelinus alpinus]
MITSAAGIISLLDEEEPQLKEFALHKLNSIVNDFWAEISGSVDKIEVLYEDETFRSRAFAALVASKVFYHLGAFDESLNYALGAGDLFNVTDDSEYVETIIAKCIDHYTKQRVENAELPEDEEKKSIDPRLEGIVNKMFLRCLGDHKYKQAIGIALETRRLDIFEKTILKSNDVSGLLAYSLKVCMSLMQNKKFRNEVLRVLVKLYMNLEKPDFINVCQCLIFLDDPQAVSDILEKLVKEDNLLMAYQICFDLYESASQQFLSSVIQNLRTVGTPIPAVPGSTNTGTVPTLDKDSDAMETDDKAGSSPAGKAADNDEPKDQNAKMTKILSGEMAIELHLQFLIRNNNTDLMILKNTKDAVRNSVCHTATVIANSFMHTGTTSDQFLRENLEWLARATNWAKFTATASLGVIHKGHEKEALQLMATYLPKDTSPGSAYQEGGGLYALGLIHANHGGDIIDYLLSQLKNASNDIVRHGGGLGLGLAALGTARQDVYDLLKSNLYQDDAVTGEAVGLALGLVMLGSKSAQAIEDMVGYAQETQHEKILRGLAVGIAMVMYGRMEEADTLIESLCRDKDPILRRSGMYTVGMAYCGSGNNKAIRRLLHVAVSDVNDDVRRAAVESIGFIMFRTPEQCPSVVSLLSESYNPHVRCGAAMALGICCAGTGNKEAINLLEPMTNDPVNYVRQGALISSALIMIQQTEVTCPKVNQFRQLYSKVINDKHDDVMAKFGAILAQGILDAGGRNVTISLQSRTGHTHMPSVVGLLVFTQFWFWFPLSHFLSLAFTPTAIIGLNKDLKMPKVQYRSNCKPSTFAYPPALEVPKEKEKEKVSTAVLSITAKAKKKEKEKKEKEEDKMEVEVQEAEKEKKDEEKEKEKKKEPEPNFQLMENPARVMPAQLKVLNMPETCRYQPFKPLHTGGIIIMKDTSEEDEELVEPVSAHGPKIEEEEQEPEAPESFEYIDE